MSEAAAVDVPGSASLTAAVLLIAVGLLPLTAAAGGIDHVWCVTGPDDDRGESCADCENETPFASVTEALEFVSAFDGPGDDHLVCVSTIFPLHESIVVDARDGSLGEHLVLQFPEVDLGLPNLCPDPASGAEQPLVSVIGSDTADPPFNFELHGVTTGTALCEEDRPFLSFVDGQISLGTTRVLGGSGPAIGLDADGLGMGIFIGDSRFEGISGPVVQGTGSVEMDGVEVSGASADSAAVLDIDGLLELTRSAVFGNSVIGAPLIRVEGFRLRVQHSLIGANVVRGGHPLIELDTVELPGTHEQSGVFASVISRNVLLQDGDVVLPPPLERVPFPAVGLQCLPAGTDGYRFRDREVPTASGTPSDAPLLAIDLGQVEPFARFSILKSFVVDNDVGDSGAFVDLRGTRGPTQLALVHNTIAGSAGLVVRGVESSGETRLVSGRNLLLGPSSSEIPAGWLVEQAMDLGEAADEEQGLGSSGHAGLIGPNPTLAFFGETSVEFIATDEVETWPPCQHGLRLCPEVEGSRDEIDPSALVCALDAAGAYVPSDDAVTAFAVRFPWMGALLPRAKDGAPSNMPGATGWSCLDFAEPYDLLATPGLPVGDLDGFSNLVDCDNDNPDRVPIRPPLDGFATPECDSSAGSCFECPEGSLPPVEGEPTPTKGGVADAPPVLCAERGCAGCGVAWSCEELPPCQLVGLLVPSLLLLRRRLR